jgi:hypothetical protein
MMYEFFNKHLQLNVPTPIEERDFVPLTQEEMSVWNDQYPKPPQDEDAEIALLRNLDAQWKEQWNALVPYRAEQWPAFHQMLRGALDIMIGRPLPQAADVEVEVRRQTSIQNYTAELGLLRYRPAGEAIPYLRLLPGQFRGELVVFVHPEGKAFLLEKENTLRPFVERWLRRGMQVLAMDVLYTGEFLRGEPIVQTRRVDNPREIAAYTLGYNHPLFAQRVHDVMTAVVAGRQDDHVERLYLVGYGPGAAWAAAACVQAARAVDRLAVWTDGFRFAPITDIRDPHFWPGALKYGDLPGVLAACAPTPLVLGGEQHLPELLRVCYQAAGVPRSIILSRDQTVEQFFENSVM